MGPDILFALIMTKTVAMFYSYEDCIEIGHLRRRAKQINDHLPSRIQTIDLNP